MFHPWLYWNLLNYIFCSRNEQLPVRKCFLRKVAYFEDRVSGNRGISILGLMKVFLVFSFFLVGASKGDISGTCNPSIFEFYPQIWSLINESYYRSYVICLRWSKLPLSFLSFSSTKRWGLIVFLSARAIREPWGVICADVSWLANLLDSFLSLKLSGESWSIS